MAVLASFAGTTGRATLNMLYGMSRVCVLVVDTANWAFVAPLRGKGLRLRATVALFVEYGVHSLPIVGLICFLIGAIMAMQAKPHSAASAASMVGSRWRRPIWRCSRMFIGGLPPHRWDRRAIE